LDEGIRVTDVTGASYALPSIREISEWCKKHSIFASYLLLENFDRDFLLPFKGRSGVSLLHFTSLESEKFTNLGFRDIYDNSVIKGGLPMVLEQVSKQKNYNITFNVKLPIFGDDPEPDWEAWREAHDWDPSGLDWSGGPCPGDPFVFAVRSEKSADVMRCFAELCDLDRESQQLGVFGMLQIVICASDFPVEARIAFIFRAVLRANREPEVIEFLVRNLHDAKGAYRLDAVRPGIAGLIDTFPAIGWTTPANNASTIRKAITFLDDFPQFSGEMEAVLKKMGHE
jgi:hypothetical protein